MKNLKIYEITKLCARNPLPATVKQISFSVEHNFSLYLSNENTKRAKKQFSFKREVSKYSFEVYLMCLATQPSLKNLHQRLFQFCGFLIAY